MKPQTITLLISTAFFVTTAAIHAQERAKPVASPINVLEMRSVPAGHYLITLQFDGQEERANIDVRDGSAKCIKSSGPRLTGMEGKFEPIGNGVFMIFFRSASGYRASQFWVFRDDGTAAIKEVPDRGEKQTAIPVRDDSIEPPKKSSTPKRLCTADGLDHGALVAIHASCRPGRLAWVVEHSRHFHSICSPSRAGF